MFEPGLFWEYAKDLLSQQDPSECVCRTAANRAYYGLFLTVRERLESKHVGKGNPLFGHDKADHRQVREILKKRGKGPLENALGTLYELREKADYELVATVRFEEVSFAMKKFQAQYENAKTL